MKKQATYKDLNEIYQLKIRKFFKYNKIDKTKIDKAIIVFEDLRMKYVIVDDKMFDLF